MKKNLTIQQKQQMLSFMSIYNLIFDSGALCIFSQSHFVMGRLLIGMKPSNTNNKNTLKKIIEQSTAQLSVQRDGTALNINGQRYKLQVYKLGGWKDVDVDDIRQTGDGYQVKASLGMFSQTDTVPSDTVRSIKMNVGKPEINLGGKTPKKLVKI